MNGADAIAFTGGIGENSPAVRAAICEGLSWFGINLDAERNAAHAHAVEGLSPIAAGVLYPFFGILLSPMIAAGDALSSMTVAGFLRAGRADLRNCLVVRPKNGANR